MKNQLVIFTVLLIIASSTNAKNSQKPCTDLEKYLEGGCIGVDPIGPTREEQLKYEKLLEQRHKAQKLKKEALENEKKRAKKEREEQKKREEAKKSKRLPMKSESKPCF